MKRKLITIGFGLGALFFWLVRSLQAQTVSNVNYSTPQIVGGVTIYGDTLAVAFQKMNGNCYFLGQLGSNNTASILILSNNYVVTSNTFSFVTGNFQVLSNTIATGLPQITVTNLTLTTTDAAPGSTTAKVWFVITNAGGEYKIPGCQ